MYRLCRSVFCFDQDLSRSRPYSRLSLANPRRSSISQALPVRIMGSVNSAGKIVLPLDVLYVSSAYGNEG